jgi:predicted metalloprotease with PDZ domain
MNIRARGALSFCGPWLILLLLTRPGFSATRIDCSNPAAAPNAPVEYFVSIADHDRHLLHVAIRYHSRQAVVFQIPVWNALYQVRNFAQYVTDVTAHDSQNHPLAVAVLDKTTWNVAPSDGCAVVEYSDYADVPSPFSAQANAEHVFLNWAQVLMYAPEQRDAPLMLTVSDLPAQWSLHDLGLFDETARDGHVQLKLPSTYDALVDSPVEMGINQVSTFTSDDVNYRIVVDAAAVDYDLPVLQEAIKKVVHAETDWMRDHPFEQYTFLFHFPRGPGGGGMEHSYGTAISVPASRLKDDPLSPVSTTAHEFFHLWNVKRIRPRQMEPVDLEHEQYTRALWFCEGVTSTVSERMLVRAGLQDERGYLSHLSELISDFESHPARHFQSPEASSLEAWMEGQGYYRRPERSVSYYTSGELLGVLLDLRLREMTDGRKSLRDLFQFMNATYPQQARFYDDALGIQRAAEAVGGGSVEDFFARYVRGTEDISYDQFFRQVGLKLQSFATPVADAGFDATLNFTGLPEVTAIATGSPVEAAGVRIGDTLTAIDDREYLGDLQSYLDGHKPGETVVFHFLSRGRVLSVKVVLKTSNRLKYSVVDLPRVSPEQRAQRAAWLIGDDVRIGDAR